jgi:aurora kinase, other
MQQYGNKVDLWCIGVLTYELLFGSLPFEIRFLQDFAKITDETISFPKSILASEEAKSFILECLAKEPSERCDIKQALKHNFLTKKPCEPRSK